MGILNTKNKEKEQSQWPVSPPSQTSSDAITPSAQAKHEQQQTGCIKISYVLLILTISFLGGMATTYSQSLSNAHIGQQCMNALLDCQNKIKTSVNTYGIPSINIHETIGKTWLANETGQVIETIDASTGQQEKI